MSNVIKFTAKAKIDAKKIVEKGQTKAKTATTPLGKQKIAEHIKRKLKEAQQTKARLAAPGALARCRHIAGGDLRAALLLYRIAGLWKAIESKMTLPGGSREYLAMTQAEWADAAGLSESECRKYAIKRLQKYASHVVQFEVHGRGAKKKTWVHFDHLAYAAAQDEAGYELKVASQAGVSGHF